jgi:UDP-2,3-diacylglucosamine pyrophosphatase LpxH
VECLLDRKLSSEGTRAISVPAGINEYRSIWISDFHLGTPRVKARALLEFLQRHRAENLFLLGDIIDGWSMGPGWCWTPEQTAVVEEIWAWRRQGARIVFIPGNHDQNDGQLVRMLFGEIECHAHTIHHTAESRRMLVIHGHQFDSAWNGSRWLSILGSVGYSSALRMNVWYNRGNEKAPARDRAIRRRIRSAVHQLIDFDDARVTEAALQHRADGVICGHTHRPDLRALGSILYANDGDWVQSNTALVEEHDGSLRLLRWRGEAEIPAEGATS